MIDSVDNDDDDDDDYDDDDDDVTLQPVVADASEDGSVAVLYSSLCSLLVLGDDLSHVVRPAVSHTLQRLNDRSVPSSLFNNN